jgi:multidrug efflux system membrane fusion protein
MKNSYIVAAGLAVAVTGWVLSGQIGEGRTPDGAAPDRMAADDGARQRLAEVRVRRLEALEHVREIVLYGRTEADRMVRLRVETAGRVASVAVDKGDAVKRGALVARLAMDDRPARLAEAEASVDHYKIAYEAARKLSQKAFRSAVQLSDAKAKLAAAEAARERIRVDMAHTKVRAPFDGVIEALPIEVGDYVAVGAEVATVVDLTPIVVVAEIAERDIDRLEVGSQARLRLAGGGELTGRIRFVSRVGIKATRTFRVEVAVDNPGARIAEGLTAELRLPIGRTMAHRVSPSVLTLSDVGAIGVKAVADDGSVRFHPVTIIADTPDGVWLGGLPRQVTLITVGQEFVRAGQRVTPVDDQRPEPPLPVAPGTGVPGSGTS